MLGVDLNQTFHFTYCVYRNARNIGLESLSTVKSSDGKLRAWIRQCLNTHILSDCITSIISTHNSVLLKSYYQSNAFVLDPDLSASFLSLLSSVETIRFGFHLEVLHIYRFM